MRHGADSGAGKNRQTQMRKVADIHAHVFPEKLADKAPASISAFYGGMEVACHPATPQKMAFYEQEAGITRFVMSNSATSAHQVRSINDFLPQAAKDAAMMTACSCASCLFIRFINLLSPFI